MWDKTKKAKVITPAPKKPTFIDWDQVELDLTMRDALGLFGTK
jgi:hypothetical protein